MMNDSDFYLVPFFSMFFNLNLLPFSLVCFSVWIVEIFFLLEKKETLISVHVLTDAYVNEPFRLSKQIIEHCVK